MKEISLTQGKVALVDDEDYDWLSQFKWFAWKGRNTYYAVRTTDKIYMHRLILNITDSSKHADHKDREGLNNQRENLREATSQQNSCNRMSRINTSSKYLGVSWSKKYKLWEANIRANSKKKWLGYFKDEKKAAIAYNSAATEIHKEFANTNVV